ncbi:MAG: imidazoleglycerol-phosphate dehydratase HisB [Eubacteriales bacterium]|nr:imidazoleglycerol-phosphate dehydratase HisB [Eubacteriales bacterium]
MRTAEVKRKTNETDITLSINLDGTGESSVNSGVGFLDHMLTLFSRHSGIDLTLTCVGDTYVDDHHSVEDIGIALGEAIKEALGDKRGIRRYASLTLPMDESLILVSMDISGRGGCYPELSFPSQKIGTFDTELVVEFLRAFAINAGITLHVRKIAGENSHHIAEGCFKGLGRALREAVETDPRFGAQIPSTKGVL